ncbi:MAG: TetR/AcrR family transcriptional regulator [Gammaproteobacteria bacterium]
MAESIARGSATRTANMAARRERILEAARSIIAAGGFDSLNLRELAVVADVTVPTIYNLIGNKSALIEQLFDETISPFENLQYIASDSDPIASPEYFFDTVVATMRENENYYRAEFLAREHLSQTGDRIALAIHERTIQIAVAACEQAKSVGLTTGTLSPRQLGSMIADHFRLAYYDWAHGNISLDIFRNRIMTGTYMCLTADAAPAHRDTLLAKLNGLDITDNVLPLK